MMFAKKQILPLILRSLRWWRQGPLVMYLGPQGCRLCGERVYLWNFLLCTSPHHSGVGDLARNTSGRQPPAATQV